MFFKDIQKEGGSPDLDFGDAFIHVAIGLLLHCFKGFTLDKWVFIFQYLPFNLAVAPWAFNQVTNPVKSPSPMFHPSPLSPEVFFFLQLTPKGL